MSVRKRAWTTSKGERKEAWIVGYSHTGQRHQRTFAKKKEADAFAQQAGVEMRAGTHTPITRSITVDQAAKDWIADRELSGREASTLRQYREHARHISSRIGHVKLGALTTVAVNAFRNDLLTSGMSPALARKVMVSLSSLLREAQAQGKVAQNVASSAKRIDVGKRGNGELEKGTDYPTPDEIRALIAVLKGKWRVFFLTAAFTGLRASELRGLSWADETRPEFGVNLKTAKIYVRQRADYRNVIGPPKSKAGSRTVPLGPRVLNALREWKLQYPRSDRRDNIARVFQLYQRRAGIVKVDGKPKYTGLHVLRHYCASWCINPVDRGGQGLQPKVVQTQLGHASITMTMDLYGHLFPEGEDAGQKLAEAERAVLG
jgi:integrase